MKTYQQFWDQLQDAYPVSKWKFRLPIATDLLYLGDGYFEKFEKNIVSLTRQTLDYFIDNQSVLYDLIDQNNESFLSSYIDGEFTGIIRWDCVVTEDGDIKVLELNADYPDWLLLHDTTYSNTIDNWEHLHRDLYLKLFDDKDDILILYPEGSVFLDAYHTEYLVLKNTWKRVHIGTPQDIIIKDDQVYFWDNKINYIKRCTEVWKLGKWFFDKMKNTNVQYINNFSLRPLGYKNALSYIDHPYVLKTQNISDIDTEYIISHKDFFVIKPSNLFEWRDIFIWKDIDTKDRQDIVHRHRDDNFVVQDYTHMHTIQKDFYEDGDIINKTVYFDICPHIFINRWDIIWLWHVLTRFSNSKILNVAQWWGIWYLSRR